MEGGAAPEDLHGVDAVSGGTITSTGVSEMLQRTISSYMPYFKTINNTAGRPGAKQDSTAAVGVK